MKPIHFQIFNEDISTIDLPDRFTFPFYYEPHPLTLIAANELQYYLQNQTDFTHNFGLNTNNAKVGLGKMFGVLIVRTVDGEVGYLNAFSGKLEDNSLPIRFVPPIYNVHETNSFFKKGEAELDKLTDQINALEEDAYYLDLKEKYKQQAISANVKIKTFKQSLKASKADRQVRRVQAKKNMSEESFEAFNLELTKESIDGQLKVKRHIKDIKGQLSLMDQQVADYEKKITHLKLKRRAKSNELQKQIFDSYQFLNINKSTKALTDIFPNYKTQQPPSGAGDCCAPRLLQYAFLNNLSPIAMGEFWWGISPKTEIRKHKQFYPACRGRCKPILAHMLKGMELDDNPMLRTPVKKDIEIVYEDDDLLVIHKEADYLTVPGKNSLPSVYSDIKLLYPKIEEPVIVHRLDMATSGLLVLAKTKEAHKSLQDQFLRRTVRKRYVAVLDGVIKQEEGMIDLPLRVDLDDRPRQLVCYTHGKTAKTKWKVIARSAKQTRVHLYPITGRTHQLRVHMAHASGLNTPIVGDDLYGKKANRLHLHAEYIQLLHPKSEKKMNFTVKANF